MATQDLVLKTVYQLTTKHDVAGLYTTPRPRRGGAGGRSRGRSCSTARSWSTAPARLHRPDTRTRAPSWTPCRTCAAPETWGGGPAVSPEASVRAPWDRGSTVPGQAAASAPASSTTADDDRPGAPDAPAPAGPARLGPAAHRGAGQTAAPLTGSPTDVRRPQRSADARAGGSCERRARNRLPVRTARGDSESRPPGTAAAVRARGAGGVVGAGGRTRPW
ncbi:hypothetical protein QJS66_10505 [Kocuria rhizophila]|nr:hypothetical protein QJS66_10505 [Kocuria rhizophila]